jgi:tetratricopeptide (TPR) repeat protein
MSANLIRQSLLVLLSGAAFWTAYGQTYFSYYDQRTASQRQLQTVEQYHLGKAIANIEGEKWALAIGECDFILRYFPDHPQALDLMGRAAESMGTPETAEAYFERAMSLFPSSATTYAAHGTFKYRLGELEDAVAAYKKSIELVPGYAEAHYNLGLAYVELRELAKANAHAQAAYRLGYPLAGLRQILERSGAWANLTDEALALALADD